MDESNPNEQERLNPYERDHPIHLSMEELPAIDSKEEINVKGEESFLNFFAKTSGPPQIVVLCLVLALAFGSTIGVVPAVMTDRCARLYHGFDGDDCASFTSDEKPDECIQGSQDAQDFSATTSLISNILTFASSSVVGSVSDMKGRKGVFVCGIFLSLFPPLSLVMVQLSSSMSPKWYYAGHSMGGLINWIAVAISSLSDVMPRQWRAPSFGLLLAGFSCGFALSPALALTMNHLGVSILSLSILVCGFIFALFFMPETLPKKIAMEATRIRKEKDHQERHKNQIIRTLLRPVNELSILNRNNLFRLLACLAFFSSMVSSADQSLLLYYLEERQHFNDKDIAIMFMLIGGLGILVQGVILKPLNDFIGERLVLVTAFCFGTLTNFIYGVANSKITIFIALGLSSFTGMSFPTISAIKSNNVDELEQGRIQGALYSISSLASAIGPMSLRFVYHETQNNSIFGPGAMYIFASFLFLIAVVFAIALPKDQANSNKCVTKRRSSVVQSNSTNLGSDSNSSDVYGSTSYF